MVKDNLEDVKLLKNLIEIPSPSGYEKAVAEFLEEKLSEFVPKKNICRDIQHNVTVTIPGKSSDVIMIDAHSDVVGYIVANINKWGGISLQSVGGQDSTILSTRSLYILANNGKNVIHSIVDRKHSHLVYDEDTELIYHPSQVELDIGPKNPTEIMQYVKIGDPVVYLPSFKSLIPPYYAGYGLDDKSGCYILYKTIKDIIQRKHVPEYTLVFTFSAQEETGNSKIMPLIRQYKPKVCIEVDVTFATDYGDEADMESEVGRCRLGEGISLYRGADIDNELLEIIFKIAHQKKVPYQIQPCGGRIGYTSLEVTGEQNGIRSLVFGIPLRNMHSPNEVINFNDLLTGSQLLKYFLVSDKLKNIL